MEAVARLVWLDRSAAAVSLDRSIPLTIGRDPANRLCLAQEAGLSRHHAELRPGAAPQQWLLCDLGSSNGTYLEGERLSGCRPLAHGDRIQLGRRGPMLRFLQGGTPDPTSSQPAPLAPQAAAAPRPARASATAPPPSAPLPTAAAGAGAQPPEAPLPTGSRPLSPARVSPASVVPSQGRPQPPSAGTITVADRAIRLDQIGAVEVRSEALHPHVFSWWVLACLGGLLLLPFPVIFWPWQAAALAVALLLGRRQEHILLLTLKDGRVHRHRFADRATALAHRRGVRRALGQDPEP
jgi:hypothetical protein